MEAAEQQKKKTKENDQPVEPLRKKSPHTAHYQMRLFIAGEEPNSVMAQKNLQAICTSHLKGNVRVKTIDVFEDFTEAAAENILVTPALIVDHPQKIRIFGNLQDRDKVLAALGAL